MKVYITKYALTSGILVRELIEQKENYVRVQEDNGLNGWNMYHGRDWHLDEQSAKDRAEEMRVAKIASLRKSIAKLEKVTFA